MNWDDWTETPEGWSRVCAVQHPRDGRRGMLVRNRLTGIFCIYSAGVFRSVSQSWAAQVVEGNPEQENTSCRNC